MLQYIEALVWPITTLTIFLGVLRYLIIRNEYRSDISELRNQLKAYDANVDLKISAEIAKLSDYTSSVDSSINAKIANISERLDDQEGDIAALLANRALK